MFKHALTHEVAYSTLLTERKRELHGLVAHSIEVLYADRLAEQYGDIAHHYSEAELWEPAVEYLELAADKAADRFAYSDALDLYRRAVESSASIGSTAAMQTASDIEVKAGLLHLFMSQTKDSVEDLRRAGALAASAEDKGREAIALALRGFAEYWDLQFDVAERSGRQALAMADAAREELHDVKVVANTAISLALHGLGQMAEARIYSDISDNLAPLAENPLSQGIAAFASWHAANWEGRFNDVFDNLERWRPASIASRNYLLSNGAIWLEAVSRAGAGHYQKSLDMLDEVVETSDRVGDKLFRVRALNTYGWIYMELGDPARAEPWNRMSLEEVISAHTENPGDPNFSDPMIRNNARLNLGDNLAALGRPEEAEAQYKLVEETVRAPTAVGGQAIYRYQQHLFHSYGELVLARGEIDRALVFADECLETSEANGHVKNTAKGRRLRGQALAASGDLTGAEREIRVSLEAALPLGNPPQIWRSYAALGNVLSAQERPGEAQDAFASALAVIEDVASGLEDASTRETFLASAEPQAIREALGQPQ